MSRILVSSILGILLIVGGIFLYQSISDSKENRRPPAQKNIKTVFVDTVQNGKVAIRVQANGNLVAKQRVELYSEVQGVFKGGSKLFKPGQLYGRGETLIRIDADEYYATVQSAKSDLYNLMTSVMPDLRLDYPQIYPKWQSYLNSFDLEKAVPSLPKMESEQEKFFISGRGLLSSYYGVKNLEQRLSKYKINAPFGGVLAETLVTEGTLVRSGQKLGEFIGSGAYELEVAVSKTYGDFLRVGKSVTLTTLDKTKTYQGKVSRINGRVEQASQTITVFIEVKDKSLSEGQYLEANLDAQEEENAIEVDRSLLLENNTIFVVRDSILDVIEVTPVYFSDKKVVLKDIPNKEIMVSKPVPGGYPGMLIKVYKEENNTSR